MNTLPTSKTLSPKHRVFIQQLLLHNDRIMAYQYAYPNASYASAKSRVCALMQQPAIAAEIDRLLSERRNKTEELHYGILQETENTLSDLRDLMTSIIKGELKSEKSYRVGDEIKTIFLRASVRDVLQGISINLKMLQNLGAGVRRI